MSPVYLTRIDPARNMERFYKLDVQPTLFGEWSLITEWGRIGSPGRVQEHPCPTEIVAFELLAKKLISKKHRGYLLS